MFKTEPLYDGEWLNRLSQTELEVLEMQGGIERVATCELPHRDAPGDAASRFGAITFTAAHTPCGVLVEVSGERGRFQHTGRATIQVCAS